MAAIWALTLFGGAALALSLLGVDLHTLQRTFPLYGLGGFSILIFGTSRLLISGMAGRDVVGGTRSAIATTLPAVAGSFGLFIYHDAAVPVRLLFGGLWSLGALMHVAITLATVSRRPTRATIPDPTAGSASRLPIRILEAASIVYCAIAAVILPLTLLGRISYPALIHVVLVGFVVTTIMSVALHIVPRFTHIAIPSALSASLTPFALIGPAMLTLGLEKRAHHLLFGALTEALAFALFGAAILYSIGRSRKMRIPDLAYLAAPISVAAGGFIAFLFATKNWLGDQLATHAILVVFGFVGFFIVAASSDLYAPSLRPGARPAKRHALVTFVITISTLGLATAALWVDTPMLARIGMFGYAAGIFWHVAGVVSSHRRAGKIVRSLLRHG